MPSLIVLADVRYCVQSIKRKKKKIRETWHLPHTEFVMGLRGAPVCANNDDIQSCGSVKRDPEWLWLGREKSHNRCIRGGFLEEALLGSLPQVPEFCFWNNQSADTLQSGTPRHRIQNGQRWLLA